MSSTSDHQPTARTVHSASSTGYAGTHATNYQSVRPGYPDSVADYILQHTILSPTNPTHTTTATPPRPYRILDVGAGTGKWTTTLQAALTRHQLSFELQAAEPVAAMAATFAEQLPSVPIVTAAASELPFGEAEFDLLTAATAFHWFCDDVSVASLHRVLKPGGYFAILGYDLTIAADWTAPMQALLDSHYPPTTPYPRHNHWRHALDKAAQQRLLTPVAHRVFVGAAVMVTDRAGFVGRFASASAIGALEGGERERVLAEFNALIDGDEWFVDKSEFVMADDIEVTIVRRVE